MAEGTLRLELDTPGQVDCRRMVRFIEPGVEAMVREATAVWTQRRCCFLVRGKAQPAEAVTERLRFAVPELEIVTEAAAVRTRRDIAYLYPGLDGEALAAALLSHVDERGAAILAERGSRHSSNVPLFLISIPKAGTHLLYELARSLGYGAGMVCPDFPEGGKWYFVEYSNPHTRAADFLIDATRRRAFGNKHHPFFRSPALFIYRDPRDILVSEANWHHLSNKSPLAGYLQELSFEERLTLLVDDPWLLGSIRDRVGAFIPWLSFPNVIPLSFEEIVGALGGGKDEAQLDLVWSIQLKLQVDGTPENIARRLFNRNSATFAEGRIGAWHQHATPEARARFNQLPADFLKIYGYAKEPSEGLAALPARVSEFRRRPPRHVNPQLGDVPILVEASYLGHNIVQFGREFYGIPQAVGPVALESADRGRLKGVLRGGSFDKVKAAVLRRWLLVDSVVERLRQVLRPWRRESKAEKLDLRALQSDAHL